MQVSEQFTRSRTAAGGPFKAVAAVLAGMTVGGLCSGALVVIAGLPNRHAVIEMRDASPVRVGQDAFDSAIQFGLVIVGVSALAATCLWLLWRRQGRGVRASELCRWALLMAVPGGLAAWLLGAAVLTLLGQGSIGID
jgi:cytochrome bd-type quinol oxidase subunit 1